MPNWVLLAAISCATLHAQRGVLPTQPHQLRALGGRETGPITSIDTSLTNPVPQIRLPDPQIPGHRRDRSIPIEDQRHRVC